MNYRFAIGDPDGAASSAWKLFNHKDDIYLTQRGGSGSQKFSFHQSGICRWATIGPTLDGSDRAMVKWRRDEIESLKPGNGVILLTLAFPTNHLSTERPADLYKGVSWITPAPAGKATGIEVFVAVEKFSDLERHFSKSQERQLHSSFQLKSGHFVAVASRELECGPVDLKIAGTPVRYGQVFGEMTFPDVDSKNTGRRIRLLMRAGSETPPLIYELGGYESVSLKSLIEIERSTAKF